MLKITRSHNSLTPQPRRCKSASGLDVAQNSPALRDRSSLRCSLHKSSFINNQPRALSHPLKLPHLNTVTLWNYPQPLLRYARGLSASVYVPCAAPACLTSVRLLLIRENYFGLCASKCKQSNQTAAKVVGRGEHSCSAHVCAGLHYVGRKRTSLCHIVLFLAELFSGQLFALTKKKQQLCIVWSSLLVC